MKRKISGVFLLLIIILTSVNIEVRGNTPSATLEKSELKIESNYSLNDVQNRLIVGDFNNDGKTDLAVFQESTTTYRPFIKVWLSTGSIDNIEQGSIWWQATGHYDLNLVDNRIVSGDFNNDNRDDIAILYKIGTSAAIYVWLSTGSSFSSQGQWWSISSYFNLDNVKNRFVVGDFNGDNYDDIMIWYRIDADTSRMYTLKSTGSSFSTQEDWWTGSNYMIDNIGDKVVSGDFNGDGKDDIAAFYDYGNDRAGIYIWLTDGVRFNWQSTWWKATSYFNLVNVDSRMVAGDFNGDGKDDISVLYSLDPNGGGIYMWKSGGSYLISENQWWAQTSGYDLFNIQNRMVAADITGDGYSDIVVLRKDGSDAVFDLFHDNQIGLLVITGISVTDLNSNFLEEGETLLVTIEIENQSPYAISGEFRPIIDALQTDGYEYDGFVNLFMDQPFKSINLNSGQKTILTFELQPLTVVSGKTFGLIQEFDYSITALEWLNNNNIPINYQFSVNQETNRVIFIGVSAEQGFDGTTTLQSVIDWTHNALYNIPFNVDGTIYNSFADMTGFEFVITSTRLTGGSATGSDISLYLEDFHNNIAKDVFGLTYPWYNSNSGKNSLGMYLNHGLDIIAGFYHDKDWGATAGLTDVNITTTTNNLVITDYSHQRQTGYDWNYNWCSIESHDWPCTGTPISETMSREFVFLHELGHTLTTSLYSENGYHNPNDGYLMTSGMFLMPSGNTAYIQLDTLNEWSSITEF